MKSSCSSWLLRGSCIITSIIMYTSVWETWIVKIRQVSRFYTGQLSDSSQFHSMPLPEQGITVKEGQGGRPTQEHDSQGSVNLYWTQFFMMLQSQETKRIENNGTSKHGTEFTWIYSQKRNIKILQIHNPTWHLKSTNLEIWFVKSCQRKFSLRKFRGYMAWKATRAHGPKRDLLCRYLSLWVAGGHNLMPFFQSTGTKVGPKTSYKWGEFFLHL